MDRDLMTNLVNKYLAGDGAASLVLEVAVRNAIDLAYMRDDKAMAEQEGEIEDYFLYRQQLDEEIDDCLPSMQELGLIPTFAKSYREEMADL